MTFRITRVGWRSVPGTDEFGALLQREVALGRDLERTQFRLHKEKAGRDATGNLEGLLSQLDSICAGAFLARLDLEGDPLTARQRVEVHRRIQPGAVEEILPSVLSGNESEPAVRDQLLDGACRHLSQLPP